MGMDSVAGASEAAPEAAAGAEEVEAGVVEAAAAAGGVDVEAAAAAGAAFGCMVSVAFPAFVVSTHLGHHDDQEVLLLYLEVADGRVILQDLAYDISVEHRLVTHQSRSASEALQGTSGPPGSSS